MQIIQKDKIKDTKNCIESKLLYRNRHTQKQNYIFPAFASTPLYHFESEEKFFSDFHEFFF